jgi:hypothetical protein
VNPEIIQYQKTKYFDESALQMVTFNVFKLNKLSDGGSGVFTLRKCPNFPTCQPVQKNDMSTSPKERHIKQSYNTAWNRKKRKNKSNIVGQEYKNEESNTCSFWSAISRQTFQKPLIFDFIGTKVFVIEL